MENLEKDNLAFEEKKLAFEKYKLQMELLKWFIGSVALVLVSMIIDFNLKDRAAGMAEVQQYDKYVSELIVLNPDPVRKRMLAQFFSNVPPSPNIKDGWVNYYKEVNAEYKVKKDLLEAENKINDTIRLNLFKTLKQTENVLVNNDVEFKRQEKFKDSLRIKIEEYNIRIKENVDKLHPEIILSPDQEVFATKLEKQGFEYLLKKDVENAIIAFQNSEKAYNSFHSVYEIANYLKKNKANLLDNSSNNKYWKIAFSDIVKQYSWKMPIEFKDELSKQSK